MSKPTSPSSTPPPSIEPGPALNDGGTRPKESPFMSATPSSPPAELTEALDEFGRAMYKMGVYNYEQPFRGPKERQYQAEKTVAIRSALLGLYNRQREEASKREQEYLAEIRRWKFTYDHQIVAENDRLSSQLERLKADGETCARDLSDAWEEIRRLRRTYE